MIVAITGPDGSGKSTACKNVAQILESHLGKGKVLVVSVWDSIAQSQLFASKQDIVRYLDDLDGYTRTLFIFHAFSRSLDLAQRKLKENQSRIILVDGFWYKYAVSEIGQGVNSAWVSGAAQGFMHPDATFYLDIDPQHSESRKEQLSQYEQGVGTEGNASERFMKFQGRLSSIWKEVESQVGPWIYLSALQPPAGVAESLAHQILGAL